MAKLINCSLCGKELSSMAASCPHCGHPNGIRSKKYNYRIVGFYLLLVLIIFIIASVILDINNALWSNPITYIFLVVYALIIVLCFVISLRQK